MDVCCVRNALFMKFSMTIFFIYGVRYESCDILKIFSVLNVLFEWVQASLGMVWHMHLLACLLCGGRSCWYMLISNFNCLGKQVQLI